MAGVRGRCQWFGDEQRFCFILLSQYRGPPFRSHRETNRILPETWFITNRSETEVPRHARVPHRLRQVNETAYEPELVSIGPCHRHKEHLREMEMVKKQYCRRLFDRKGEETKRRCVQAVRSMAEFGLYWYSPYDENIADIETMLLVDGCFIIELLCKEPQDEFARLRWSRITLFGDLLLLENQLPFPVLKELYRLINDPTDGTDFAPQAFAKLIQVLPGKNAEFGIFLRPASSAYGIFLPRQTGIENGKGRVERQSIGCATELAEAGIKFVKVESNAKSLFDVNFTDGEMKIPTFVIGDNTERLLRNLIAYELFVHGLTYVIDYVTLMDNLVNTANDVKLLRSSGVIVNMLGDDEAVGQMINKLRDFVTLCGDAFFYEKIFVEVQQHCAKPWNTWKAKIRHDYFTTPWSGIAFYGALLVALATIGQFIVAFFQKQLS
ncbi:hypothetical protein PTKIN_Ptkin14bG0230100 [Pterospermum kingtungense]